MHIHFAPRSIVGGGAPIHTQRRYAMADPTEKHFLNVPGRYYNDTTCIDCDICREMAPAFFRRSDDDGATFVWRQPETETETALAEEARLACPTESIGNDG